MKIKFEQNAFKPITITIETQKELDQLVAMANHVNFADEYENDVSADIFNELEGFVKTKYIGDSGIALYEDKNNED